MRIIAGQAGGIRLHSLKGSSTRPTLDRVKEDVFNILGGVIAGCRGLDLFAGFGGLGLEALSRGAESMVFVEKNYRNTAIIRKNIKLCRFAEQAEVVCADVVMFLEKAENSFDLIFLDPPYQQGYLERVFTLIARKKLLTAQGIIVCEHHFKEEAKYTENLNLIREKKYGETIIDIYQEEGN